MNSPRALKKYKEFVMSGDKAGIDRMMLFDAVYIPVIKTIVNEYPGYIMMLDGLDIIDLGNSYYDVVDFHYFVTNFFKWCKDFDSMEEFITMHKLEKEVGW